MVSPNITRNIVAGLHASKKIESGKRAEDQLSLPAKMMILVEHIQRSNKKVVGEAIKNQAQRMVKARKELEIELLAIMKKASVGILAKIKYYFDIKHLKTKLLEINRRIVSWVNITAEHYAIKV
jgi:hypothetical protein